jgi:uncharacterized protein Veg
MKGLITELNFSDLVELYPEQFLFEFSDTEQKKAWEIAQKIYSYKVARWNAYLNLLVLQCFVNYLETEKSELGEFKVCFNDLGDNSNHFVSSFWEFINGAAIQCGNFRLILIPNDSSATDEFCIPQEWVDIRELAGDYYVAAQVNLEKKYVHFWGYTTHKQIKQKAEYDSWERSYLLDKDDLRKNLTLMWIEENTSILEREKIAATIRLLLNDKKNLIQEVGKPTPYSPRLDADFPKWAALLIDHNSRLELCLNRGCKIPKQKVIAAESATQSTTKQPVKLSEWLQQIFDHTWQTAEDILDTLTTPEGNLAYGMGCGDRHREMSPVTAKAIPGLIDLLQDQQNKITRFRAANLLGDIAYGNQQAIAALTDMIQSSEDEDTRRQAAINLGKIDPKNPQAGVRRAKLIDFGITLKEYPLILVVTVMPDFNNKTQVHFRVSHVKQETNLPPNLKLTILDEDGQIFQEVTSRNADNIIQRSLRCSQGDAFSVRISWENVSITEDFVF